MSLTPSATKGGGLLTANEAQNTDLDVSDWIAEYVRFEMQLLNELGFGMDLSECAATGTTEELIYVSPKSGRAVSRSAGEAYKERLLPLPEFLIAPAPPTGLSMSLTPSATDSLSSPPLRSADLRDGPNALRATDSLSSPPLRSADLRDGPNALRATDSLSSPPLRSADLRDGPNALRATKGGGLLTANEQRAAIEDGLKLTGFFLAKHWEEVAHKHLPEARFRLVEALQRAEDSIRAKA